LFGPDFALVHRIAIVENLDLHALISGVPFIRRANADAVVGAGGKLEFEPQRKITEFLFGKQIASAVRGAHDYALLRDVAGPVAADELPSTQGLPVEQGGESGLVGGESDRNREEQSNGDLMHKIEFTIVRTVRLVKCLSSQRR